MIFINMPSGNVFVNMMSDWLAITFYRSVLNSGNEIRKVFIVRNN
jgi:hypothetical protein